MSVKEDINSVLTEPNVNHAVLTTVRTVLKICVLNVNQDCSLILVMVNVYNNVPIVTTAIISLKCALDVLKDAKAATL